MRDTLRKEKTASKGHGEKFSRKDGAAICALITEPTITAAARKAGISDRTLRRWLQDLDFRERYEDERRHRLDAATRSLEQAAAVAIKSLSNIADYVAEPKNSIAAATKILDAVFRKIELYNLGRRVSRLERKIQGDDMGERPKPVMKESGAATSHDATWSGVPDNAPPITKQSKSTTESHSEAHRDGEEEPVERSIALRRRL
jgi:AraC-like DNA-binding protein